MKNYINANNEIYSYDDDIPKEILDIKIKDLGLVAISDADLATLKASQVVPVVISIVTMRQARLALFQSDILTTITDAIMNGTDEAMKIEWEYATSVEREWPSLVALAESLNMTSQELDDLFLLASTL